MPKFSVVVGTYNQEKTLPMLIEALNNQTFRDFEVHFCDDGSDYDVRKEIFAIERDGIAQHPAFQKVEQVNVNISFPYEVHVQKHKGMRLAKNINQGIKAARGEYCVFIMGDSFPDPRYLEVLHQFAQPGRVLCGVRYDVDGGKGVDVDWRLKKAIIPPENAILVANPWSLTTGNGLTVPTAAFRAHGGWDESFEGYGGEDGELVARLYYKGYTVWSIVDAKLYHHWHKATASANTSNVVRKLFAYAN